MNSKYFIIDSSLYIFIILYLKINSSVINLVVYSIILSLILFILTKLIFFIFYAKKKKT